MQRRRRVASQREQGSVELRERAKLSGKILAPTWQSSVGVFGLEPTQAILGLKDATSGGSPPEDRKAPASWFQIGGEGCRRNSRKGVPVAAEIRFAS